MNSTGTVTVDGVKDVVVSTLGIEGRADQIGAATPLFGAMPELDSMAVIELVVALEERFGVNIGDDEITDETFASIGALAAFIEAKSG